MGPRLRERRWFRALIWPTWEQRKRLLRVEAWIAVSGAFALLLFAHAWPDEYQSESPGMVAGWWIAFMIRVLAFHIGLLMAAIAATALYARIARLAIAAGCIAAFILVPAWWHFGSPTAEPPGLKIMSLNLLMVNQQTEAIMAEIESAAPDVVLLQEYSAHWHAAMSVRFAQRYPFARVDPQEDSFGLAVYSRLPLTDEREPLRLGRVEAPEMRFVVTTPRGEIALYNIHLVPPRRFDYTVEHRLQFADLLDVLAREQRPVVLAGDFNFTDGTPQALGLERVGLRDSHEAAGWGRGATWPVNGVLRYIVPGLRLDHIYVRAPLRAVSCETGFGTGSDHRPVIVELAW